MPIITPLQNVSDVMPLSRPHRMYGTAPTTYNRVVTLNRATLQYICSASIYSGIFESYGLPPTAVGTDLITIALDDTNHLSPLVLDYTQIGT